MKQKNQLRWITQTALMLALLIALQAITKPLGQLVTGSFVNAMLAVTVLIAGCGSGLTVAVISPVLAYLLGIAPQILTVPAIMVGNAVYILLLHLLSSRRLLAWLTAAVAKFAVLYAIVVWLICGLLSEKLIQAGLMKAPMLNVLPATFSWPQLITALIGGGVAVLMVPVIRKAIKK